MKYINNATLIRRNIFKRLAECYQQGGLIDSVDKTPYELASRDENDLLRCCVYKERAILKYRVMAALGFAVEEEADESLPLSHYANQALKRTELSQTVLTVLDVACAGCVPSQYLVTNACRGCMARPCTLNCPVDAISIQKGQSVIDYDKCIDCGKCSKVCPYHAIIRIPVPCEEACPVGAIKKDESNKAVIDFDKCISCGKCMGACPFGAVMERSQFIDVLQAIKAGKKVIAMFAPAIIGQYQASIEQIADAILKLGFAHVIEVAVGADKTTDVEIEEFEKRMKRGDHIMTSSCCPAYTEAVKRYVPEMQPFVSHAKTPMHYCAAWAKEKYPDAVTVFIGPCIAKRHEALHDDLVNYVITFEELDALFAAYSVDVQSCQGAPLPIQPKSHSRGFATSCGVTAAILKNAGKELKFKPEFIEGLDRKGILKLKSFAQKTDANFLEVMACEGGCVGGPCTIGKLEVAKKAVERVSKKD